MTDKVLAALREPFALRSEPPVAQSSVLIKKLQLMAT